MPLYTQNQSPYPNFEVTDQWSKADYAFGSANTGCGKTIGSCGCAMVSAVMVARYYGITNTQGNDVNPGTLNAWLQNNTGYYPGGAMSWYKVAQYTDNQLAYDANSGDFSTTNYSLANSYLDLNRPVIAKVHYIKDAKTHTHFIVLANKLSSDNYEVKDPAFYNTKTLDESETNIAEHIRAYSKQFAGLRLFKPNPSGTATAYLAFNVASPADIVVTDPAGNKLGYDPSTNETFTDIPNASYVNEMYDDPDGNGAEHNWKIAYIPTPSVGDYTLKVTGTGTGTYTIAATSFDGSGNDSQSQSTGSTEDGQVDSFIATYDMINGTGETILEQVNIPDVTAPEVSIAFDQNNKDLSVTAVDEGSATSTTKENLTYTIADASGNTTKLNLVSDAAPFIPGISPINLRVKDISYNANPKIKFPHTTIEYKWNLANDGSYKKLTQTIKVKDAFKVVATYNATTNLTHIVITKPNLPEEVYDKNGMTIITLSTVNGMLTYAF